MSNWTNATSWAIVCARANGRRRYHRKLRREQRRRRREVAWLVDIGYFTDKYHDNQLYGVLLQGNQTDAAKLLGVHRSTISRDLAALREDALVKP